MGSMPADSGEFTVRVTLNGEPYCVLVAFAAEFERLRPGYIGHRLRRAVLHLAQDRYGFGGELTCIDWSAFKYKVAPMPGDE